MRWIQLIGSTMLAATVALAQGGNIRTVYVFSGTHFDTTFTGPPPFSYARNYRILDAVLKLAKEQPDLRFMIENQYVFQDYLRAHPEKLAGFREAIRSGRIELAAQWDSMLQNLVTGEDLERNVEMASQFALKNFDVTPVVQSLSDAPGQTSQAPQILSRAGVRGLIITRAGPRDAHLFLWQGLDGSRIRTATLPEGYAGGYLMGLAESLDAMEGTKPAVWELSDISADIMTTKIRQPASLKSSLRMMYPPGIDRALVEVAWDNIMPPVRLAGNIKAWNRKHPDGPKLVAELPGKFFQEDWPKNVPLKTGEIPSVWDNGGWTLIGGYQKHIRTTHTLLRAEKWGAMASALLGWKYPSDLLRQAWGEHLITLDHESHGLRAQADEAEDLANKVSQNARDALASHVRIPGAMDIGLVVFNALNWQRTGTVTTDVYLVGDPFAFFTRPYHKLSLVDADGKEVPFEIVHTESSIVRMVRIRFRAESVPPLGWKTYYLRPSDTDRSQKFAAAKEEAGDVQIGNDATEMTFERRAGLFRFQNRATGGSVILSYHHQPQSLNSAPGFFRKKDSGNPVPVVWSKILRGMNLAGPYLEADGTVMGTRLRIGVQIEPDGSAAISETVNPTSGDAVRLIRSTEFPGEGRFIYGVPFGAQVLEDLMPGAGPAEAGSFDQLSRDDWKKMREFDGWVAWQAPASETVVASEARGGRFNDHTLSVNLLDADHGPGVPDSAHPIPGEFVTHLQVEFSKQMGNGPRVGWQFYNPLEPTITVAPLSGTLPATFGGADNNDGAIVTALKRADDGRGLVMRASALDRPAVVPQVLAESGWKPQATGLIEQNGTAAAGTLKPWEIRTVRLAKTRLSRTGTAGSAGRSHGKR